MARRRDARGRFVKATRARKSTRGARAQARAGLRALGNLSKRERLAARAKYREAQLDAARDAIRDRFTDPETGRVEVGKFAATMRRIRDPGVLSEQASDTGNVIFVARTNRWQVRGGRTVGGRRGGTPLKPAAAARSLRATSHALQVRRMQEATGRSYRESQTILRDLKKLAGKKGIPADVMEWIDLVEPEYARR